VQGKDAVTYLDPGALTSSLSYVRLLPPCSTTQSSERANDPNEQVMGPLVKALEQLGYVYGDDLSTAGMRHLFLLLLLLFFSPCSPDAHVLVWLALRLCAMQYDWRLPPKYLEERDGYFTNLKKTIEDMSTRHQKPVALMGHSMGNRVVQYFLNWIVHNDPAHGRQWISGNGSLSSLSLSPDW